MSLRMFTSLFVLSCLPALATDNIRLAHSFYSSQRAWRTGDLLTIVIQETTSSAKSEDMATSKAMSASADPATITGATAGDNRLLIFGDKTYQLLPTFSFSGNSNFTGAGSTNSRESLSANLTARIVDMLPNGVLLVRGHREVVMRGETVTMVLTGMVRKQDIGADNTVDSTKLADASIRYESSGEVSRASRPGWFTRLFSYMNPF